MTQTPHDNDCADPMTNSVTHPVDDASAAPAPANPAASRRAAWLAWLWFAPPFALLLLRFWLNTRAESLPAIEPITLAPYVQTPAGHDDAALRALMWQASLPLLKTVAALVVIFLIARWAIRRWGWRRVAPAATGLWCVLCAGAALTLVAGYVNHAGLTPLPPVTATVIAAQPYPSTDNAPGGARVWLHPPAENGADAVPWRVRFEGADFQAMPPGSHVTLQRARGALWGTYMTESDAPQAQPMLPPAAPGSANANAPSSQPADPS